MQGHICFEIGNNIINIPKITHKNKIILTFPYKKYL